MEVYNIHDKIDCWYGCTVGKELSLIGNEHSCMGFKNAGSTGEKRAGDYIIREMKKIGLSNITEYSFDVDAWEFKNGFLEYFEDGKRIEAPLSAFAGVNGSKGLIETKVVDVGHGTYRECIKKDIRNSIALIRIDLSKGYWIGVPAYQLELMGALAIIVILEGELLGDCDYVLNSGDAIARANIPIMNISRQNGEKLTNSLKNGNIIGKLNANFALSKGKSRNISGEIPGKNENRCILLGAHYDSFFNAYFDDAFGVGAVLTIAKAIIESRYMPEYTIRIIVHGAEEFGVCNSRYDWCTGSWKQISEITPEWTESTLLFLNIDAVSPDAEELLVQASPQLHEFLEKCFVELSDSIKEEWEKGEYIEDINGAWSDDFNYYIEGVPVIICGRGNTAWRRQFYHTNYDNSNCLKAKRMKNLCRIYMELIYKYDKSKVTPLILRAEIDRFWISIDRQLLKSEGVETAMMDTEIVKLLELLKFVCSIREKEIAESIIININKKIIRVIRAVDADDGVIYRLEEVQRNLEAVNKIMFYCEKNKYTQIMRKIKTLIGGNAVCEFENNVYKYWYIDILSEKSELLNWGKDLIERPMDIRKLYNSVYEKNQSELFEEINFLKKKEIQKAKRCVNMITECLEQVNKLLTKKIGEQL